MSPFHFFPLSLDLHSPLLNLIHIVFEAQLLNLHIKVGEVVEVHFKEVYIDAQLSCDQLSLGTVWLQTLDVLGDSLYGIVLVHSKDLIQIHY